MGVTAPPQHADSSDCMAVGSYYMLRPGDSCYILPSPSLLLGHHPCLPLTSFLLLLPDDPPLEGSAPGSTVVTQLGPLTPVLALEPGSVTAGDAGGFARVPETSAQMQVAQEGQLGTLSWDPRGRAGLVLGDGRLAHKARVQEDQAPGRQVEHQEGKETHGLPAEIPLEFEPELGHSRLIPDWLAGSSAGRSGVQEGEGGGCVSQASLRDGTPGGLQSSFLRESDGQNQSRRPSLALGRNQENRTLLWSRRDSLGHKRGPTSRSWSHFPTSCSLSQRVSEEL